MELEELRVKIDELDEQLRSLLKERMEVSVQVGEYKKKNNVAIFHPEREKEILEKNVAKMEKLEFRSAYRDILRKIMETSRRIQGNILFEKSNGHATLDLEAIIENQKPVTEARILGYQGIPGSYSSEALGLMMPGDEPRRNYPTFSKAVEALKQGEISDLILPVENSSTGGVKEVEHLIASEGLCISGEYALPINHALLGVPNSNIHQIKKVYSHSQALSQCARFIEESGYLAEPYFNTAMSAKKVLEANDPRSGAIASLQAAKLYGLSVLAENIGDNGTNYTRFVRVRRTPIIDEECNKISVRLSMAHEIGSLYRIIGIITESDLNMTRIESRPIFGKPWEYYFFIDFEGNLFDDRVRKAMYRMMESSSQFEFLGNYKKGSRYGQGD
jgi:chorismate mutase/prephenate dehydratase